MLEQRDKCSPKGHPLDLPNHHRGLLCAAMRRHRSRKWKSLLLCIIDRNGCSEVHCVVQKQYAKKFSSGIVGTAMDITNTSFCN
ncbi:uncharacterized protein [Panulirus ornatus]|uniref:uncharacterized protein isoform X6 n=1 Tax=Panulirus ornatus TaxID=150431 RepID=UPI003A89117E